MRLAVWEPITFRFSMCFSLKSFCNFLGSIQHLFYKQGPCLTEPRASVDHLKHTFFWQFKLNTQVSLDHVTYLAKMRLDFATLNFEKWILINKWQRIVGYIFWNLGTEAFFSQNNHSVDDFLLKSWTGWSNVSNPSRGQPNSHALLLKLPLIPQPSGMRSGVLIYTNIAF